MISKTKFRIYGRQFVLETLILAIEEFATGDSGVGKGNFVVTRFES